MASQIETVLQNRLSNPRLAPYVTAAGGDLKAGLRLYRWNIELSGALYEALHVVEVVLRNTLHNEMEALQRLAGRPGSWLDNPPACLQKRAQDDIAVAKSRAQTALQQKTPRAAVQPPVTPDAIVAQLSFGFWRYLLARRYEPNLWTQALRRGFPGLPGGGALRDVEQPVHRLHLLRNRIGHLEPIYEEKVKERVQEMATVVGFICRDTQSWLSSVHRVDAVLATRPSSNRTQ